MPIDQIFVDVKVADDPLTRRICEKIGLSPVIIDSQTPLFDSIKSNTDPWQKGKQILWLTYNKGAFLKKCPGTRDYLCCGYQILHFGAYCTMDCAYCILQSYFHPPVLQFFINHDELMLELDNAFEKKQTLRIGTGEFTDSLIWETWTDLTPKLIIKFASQVNAVLELKTKTVAIGGLKNLPHHRKTILSWSLNTPQVIETQERGTASLQARLRAAAQCQTWGYPLAFHFDPMIIYPGCEDAYQQVLCDLFSKVSAENIVWISMGTLRFMPDLQPVIKQRFPESDIIYGEFITGLDGKMRYFKQLRINLYQRMVQLIKDMAPNVLVYLCMEDEQVWTKSFGFSPGSNEKLAALLDASARRHCRIK